MDGFSAKGSVMEGLSLIRRRPGLIIVWVVLGLVLAVLTAGSIQLQNGMIHASIAAGQSASAAAVKPQLLLAVTDVISIGLSAVVWASAYRALLRPQDRPPLALGRAEWRVLWARVIPQLILAVPALLLIPLRFRLFPPQWAPVMDVLLVVITVCTAFWSAVSGVWAFDSRIAPFRAWRLARGHVWKLVAVFAACALIVRAARFGLVSAAVLVNHHVPLPGRVPLDAMGAPAPLLMMVGSAVISAVEVAVLAGIVAAAYRAYRAGLADDEAPMAPPPRAG